MTVDFKITDQSPISYSASDSGEKNKEYNEAVHQLFMWTLRKTVIKLRGKNCTTLTMNLIFP
jgi:hypothetical protein